MVYLQRTLRKEIFESICRATYAKQKYKIAVRRNLGKAESFGFAVSMEYIKKTDSN